MKRIFALVLVLALAIGCLAGCGEDKKIKDNNNGKDEAPSSEKTEVMTFNEISETVSKLSKGSEIDIKLSVAVKPVFDETFTESDLLAHNVLLSKNSKGLYEIPVSIKGFISDSVAELKLKVAEREVSDIIVAEEKAYLNAKSFFNFIKPFVFGVELAWPCENDYIDIVSFVEYYQNMMAQQMPEDNYDINTEWSDEGDLFAENSAVPLVGIAFHEETKQQIMDVIEVLKTAIPETMLNSIVNQIVNIAESNKVISKHEDHISFKLDKTNIKGFALAIAGVVRTNGADLIDLVIQN